MKIGSELTFDTELRGYAKREHEELLKKFGYTVRIYESGGKPSVYVRRYAGCYINITNYHIHLNITNYSETVENIYRDPLYFTTMKSELEINSSAIGVTTVSANFKTFNELKCFLMEFDKELGREIKINDLFTVPLF